MKSTPRTRHEGIDLLAIPIVRAVVRWKGFPAIFQLVLLGAFVWLAARAWGVHPPEGTSGKLFAKSNLTTLLVWGIWWPMMVWAAVILGRAWCMICPLEWVASATERFADASGLRRRPLPRWIAGGSLIVLLYIGIQMMVAGVDLHRVPAYTSVFLGGLLGLAMLSALVFRNRAFCRGFCPVGLLLGTYGRGGVLAVRPACSPDEATPMRGCSAPPANARSCPSLLNPARLDENSDCLVCGACVKASAPGSMRLLVRPPFDTADARKAEASWPVTLFVMVVSGFVLLELFSEWPAAERYFLLVPRWLAGRVGASHAEGWIEGVWSLAVVPFLMWSLLAACSRAVGNEGSFTRQWRHLALPVCVLVAAGHMCKGVAKLATWAPFLPDALHSPDGVELAHAIAARTVAQPVALLSPTSVSVIGCVLLAVGFLYAVREHRLARDTRETVPYRWLSATPLATLAVCLLALVIGWA